MSCMQHLWVFWVRVQRFKGCALLAQQVINYSLGNGKKNEIEDEQEENEEVKNKHMISCTFASDASLSAAAAR